MRGIIGGVASVTQETRGGDARGLFTRGMRLVVAYVCMHPRPFLVSVAGSLVFAVSSVLLTTALGRATDQVLKPSFSGPVPASSIWLAVLALMTFGVGRALGIMFRRYYSGVAGERVMATLRNRVADRYRDLQLQYHRETPTGELLAHMEADVKAAVDVFWPVPFATGVIAMTLLAMGSLLHADPWLALIGLILAELPRAVVGYARLEEVFRTSVTLNPPAHPEELPAGPLGIEVLGLRHLYDGVPILDGVTFDVQPMESVAIVGPTGVGKSTLAQLLVRLADPEQGRVLVAGVDVRDADPVALRRDVSIVFQESFLFATTVRENIALDAEVAESDVVRSAMIASADRFIRELPHGYDTVVGERGYTLSGGQRQRVALARALVRAPP